MFYLSEIEHTMRVPPHLLNLPLNDAIQGELERLFLDKVSLSPSLPLSLALPPSLSLSLPFKVSSSFVFFMLM